MASPSKKSFALRIDPALWAEVERLAATELRSANAQVEYLLREALARRGIQPGAAARGHRQSSNDSTEGGTAESGAANHSAATDSVNGSTAPPTKES